MSRRGGATGWCSRSSNETVRKRRLPSQLISPISSSNRSRMDRSLASTACRRWIGRGPWLLVPGAVLYNGWLVEAVVTAMVAGVAVFDPDGTMTSANRTAWRIFAGITGGTAPFASHTPLYDHDGKLIAAEPNPIDWPSYPAHPRRTA